MGRKGLKIYSSKKVILLKEEKEILDGKIQKQIEKFERDSKCGGMEGCCFVRLHDRSL